MNIVEFNNWLLSKGYNKKLASDIISRLKRIDTELLYLKEHTCIDDEYKKDNCLNVLNSLKKNKAQNNIFKDSSLPIQKSEIANYKSALNRYIKYLES